MTERTNSTIEKEIIKWYCRGEKSKDISNHFSLHESTITEIMRRNGHDISNTRSRDLINLNDGLYEQIIDLWNQYRSLKPIHETLSKHYIISREYIRTILINDGLYQSATRKKYNNTERDIIHTLYLNNIPVEKIVSITGFTEWTVRKALKEAGVIFEKFIKNFDRWNSYLSAVRKLTEENFQKYYYQINPQNFKRGKFKYHLDHKFSIHDGFIEKIKPEIISNWTNLQMLYWRENLKKHKSSTVSKELLIEAFNMKGNIML